MFRTIGRGLEQDQFDKGDYDTHVTEDDMRVVILGGDPSEGGDWWNPCTDR